MEHPPCFGWIVKRADVTTLRDGREDVNLPGSEVLNEPHFCHCEEPGDEAISVYYSDRDCFASLAMTQF